MIQREFFDTHISGKALYRTYSDAGMMIQKVGTAELYSEAIDLEDAPYTYEETDVPIESEEVTDEQIHDVI